MQPGRPVGAHHQSRQPAGSPAAPGARAGALAGPAANGERVITGRQAPRACRFSTASGLFQLQLAPSALNLSPVPGLVPGADNGRKSSWRSSTPPKKPTAGTAARRDRHGRGGPAHAGPLDGRCLYVPDVGDSLPDHVPTLTVLR